MKDNEYIINVQGLVKSFNGLKVLDGVDFEISRGEVVTILGPSGCGKSTLLRCMNLLEKPDSGHVLFEGTDLTEQSSADIIRYRRKIGMVFQHFNVFPHLTALENITLAPVENGMLSKEEAEKKALALLERIGLSDKKDSIRPDCRADRSSASQSCGP